MSNKIILKKSSVGTKVPVTGDLDYGELALNYADGKLYFKDSSNNIQFLGSSSAAETLTNKTLTSAILLGSLIAGGGAGTAGQVLQSTGSGVQWANASTGSSSGGFPTFDAGLITESINSSAAVDAGTIV